MLRNTLLLALRRRALPPHFLRRGLQVWLRQTKLVSVRPDQVRVGHPTFYATTPEGCLWMSILESAASVRGVPAKRSSSHCVSQFQVMPRLRQVVPQVVLTSGPVALPPRRCNRVLDNHWFPFTVG